MTIKEQIEKDIADFFDEGECSHTSVVCGTTIRNDPAHCASCLLDFTLSKVLAQIRRDAEKIEELRLIHKKLQQNTNLDLVMQELQKIRAEECESIAAAILAQIEEKQQ